jgi:hypothetical protein
MHLLRSIAIWPYLELKTQPKQLLGSLPLDIALPEQPWLVVALLEYLDKGMGYQWFLCYWGKVF